MKNNPLDKIVDNFIDTGKLINEYASTYKVQNMVKYLNSDNLDDYRKALGIWGGISDYDKSHIEYEMIGDIPLIDKIDVVREIISIKSNIDDTVKNLGKSNHTPKEKLDKISEIISDIEYNDYDTLFHNEMAVLNREYDHYEKVSTGAETHKREKSEKELLTQKNIEVKQEPISILSKNNQEDKSSLNILHNIFLYGFNNYKNEKLEKESEDSNFGDNTEKMIKHFQKENGLPKNGVVDKDTWEKIIEQVDEDSFSNLEGSSVFELFIHDTKGKSLKEKLFLSSINKVLQQFTEDGGIYKSEIRKRGLVYDPREIFLPKMEEKIQNCSKENGKYKIVLELESQVSEKMSLVSVVEKLTKDNAGRTEWEEIYKKVFGSGNPTKSFKRPKKIINKLVTDIDQLNKRINDMVVQCGNFEKNNPDLLKWTHGPSYEAAVDKFIEYRQSYDLLTVSGNFNNIKNKILKVAEENLYSYNDLTNILYGVNSAFVKIKEKYSTNVVRRRELIKTLIGDINEYKSPQEMVDFIETFTNTNAIAHYIYERSFCDCDGGYFSCSNLGDRSRIIYNANRVLIDKLNSVDSTEKIADDIYDIILSDSETKIDKFDIITEKDIKLDSGLTISTGTKIEVKKTNKVEYHLSEFFGVYKTRKNINQHMGLLGKYNEVIEKLVSKLQQNDGGIKEKILNDLGGIFLDNYMYYPNFDLEWSTEGVGRKGDHRLTLRFKVIGEGYQWKEGNCNITPTKGDHISEYVNNLLDL